MSDQVPNAQPQRFQGTMFCLLFVSSKHSTPTNGQQWVGLDFFKKIKTRVIISDLENPSGTRFCLPFVELKLSTATHSTLNGWIFSK